MIYIERILYSKLRCTVGSAQLKAGLLKLLSSKVRQMIYSSCRNCEVCVVLSEQQLFHMPFHFADFVYSAAYDVDLTECLGPDEPEEVVPKMKNCSGSLTAN